MESPRSIDKESKPIIACVEGKEFALADVIKMEQAGISYPFKIQLADSLTSM